MLNKSKQMFNNLMLNFLMCFLAFCYPWIHNFFRWVGEKILTSHIILKKYIRLINIIYLLILGYVISFFVFTDFSIFSGWEYVTTYDDEGKNIFAAGRGPLFAILFIIYPPMIFFGSIINFFTSWFRLKNPGEALTQSYD